MLLPLPCENSMRELASALASRQSRGVCVLNYSSVAKEVHAKTVHIFQTIYRSRILDARDLSTAYLAASVSLGFTFLRRL